MQGLATHSSFCIVPSLVGCHKSCDALQRFETLVWHGVASWPAWPPSRTTIRRGARAKSAAGAAPGAGNRTTVPSTSSLGDEVQRSATKCSEVQHG